MVGRGVYPGNINTSDGMTKSLYSVNLRNLLAGNMFRIVTEEREKETEENNYIETLHFVSWNNSGAKGLER